MIPKGVLFRIGGFSFSVGTASIETLTPEWVKTPPSSKPHHGSTVIRPYVSIESEREIGQSFTALPGSPYLGYTGAPFGGAPAGFGTAGIGPIGFALMILTSPGIQSLFRNDEMDPLHPGYTV